MPCASFYFHPSITACWCTGPGSQLSGGTAAAGGSRAPAAAVWRHVHSATHVSTCCPPQARVLAGLDASKCRDPPGLGPHVCLSESRLASPCGPVFACSEGPGPWQDPAVLAQLEQQRQQRIADAGRPAGMTVPEQLQAAGGAGTGSSGQVEAAEDAPPQAPEPATLAAATT